MVSVDVKHHVYLLNNGGGLSPSLISLMVSVDVKHHVYLLTNGGGLSPSLISLMVSVDVKHVYLLTCVWILFARQLSPPTTRERVSR